MALGLGGKFLAGLISQVGGEEINSRQCDDTSGQWHFGVCDVGARHP